MSSLLCQFGVVGADAAHIRRLEVALRQAQTEKESILTKLHKLEKQQVRLTCLVYCTESVFPPSLGLKLYVRVKTAQNQPQNIRPYRCSLALYTRYIFSYTFR